MRRRFSSNLSLILFSCAAIAWPPLGEVVTSSERSSPSGNIGRVFLDGTKHETKRYILIRYYDIAAIFAGTSIVQFNLQRFLCFYV